MRAIAMCAVLAGCSAPEPAPVRAATGPQIAVADAAASSEPGVPSGAEPRLADDVVPIAYDLTLELDPDRETFSGQVAISIRVAAPGTARLWLHAVDLEIASARLRDGDRDDEVTVLAGDPASPLRGFALPRAVGGPGRDATVALVIAYTGHVRDLSQRTGNDEEGVFRERAGGRWYLYTQAESVFARKIVPCFDEPRWKSAWRVTAVVPRDQVALANGAALAERALPDGRREIRFAEIAALPSYLLAVAVGPFELVDAGRLGRARVPARFAVARGDRARLAGALGELPRIVDALERYLDAPLPLAKLDVVAVPQFFGAMENPGLITIEAESLVGGRERVATLAHELAHQWFGNSVTPVWWDQLWLSEAFATWLGDRITASIEGARPPEQAHAARAQAIAADDAIDAVALVHAIRSSADVEPAFDAIAYAKGSVVLAMLEWFAGAPAFRGALRGYLAAHAGTSVGAQAFLDALGTATSPELAGALSSMLAHAGLPVVELSLRCGAAPAIVAAAHDGATVPVCVRVPAAPTGAATVRTCFVAGAHSEQALPAAVGCPAWLVGNAGGHGYYRTAWRDPARRAPLAALSADERLVVGDDVAGALQHGELPIAAALAELTALAAMREPYGELAALAIARAIDAVVAEPVRPAWRGWLAGRFARHLTRTALLGAGSPVERAVRGELVDLVAEAIDPATLEAARAALDRHPRDELQLRLAAAAPGGARVFDRIVAAAVAATSDAQRDDALDALAGLPARDAARIVDTLLDPRFPASQVWPALASQLARGATRSAAWRAVRDRFAEVLAALAGSRARDVIAATAALCDASARAEVIAAATPRLAEIAGGRVALDHALATIDRCIARRSALGDLAGALAAASLPTGRGSTLHP